MLKCKDCLHHEVCRKWYILTGHSAKEADEISELEHEYEGNFCTYSKDKSLIAEPVRHGHWIPKYVSKKGLSGFFKCSECNKIVFTAYPVEKCPYNYCSNCGAKMDLEDNP